MKPLTQLSLTSEKETRKFSRRRSGKQDGPRKAIWGLLGKLWTRIALFALELQCWPTLPVKGQIIIIFDFASPPSLSLSRRDIFCKLLKYKTFPELTDCTKLGFSGIWPKGCHLWTPVHKSAALMDIFHREMGISS